jgi:hypothetical protein
MDAILGYRPQSHFAIQQMDRAVLESARSAIVRYYQEFGLLETVVDVAAFGGIRALAKPFDLRHITRALVRSLVAEGLNAYWDKTCMHGPFAIKVSWRTALRNASQARRRARKSQKRQESTMLGSEETSPTSCKDFEGESLKLPIMHPASSRAMPLLWNSKRALANPAKMRKASATPENQSP